MLTYGLSIWESVPINAPDCRILMNILCIQLMNISISCINYWFETHQFFRTTTRPIFLIVHCIQKTKNISGKTNLSRSIRTWRLCSILYSKRFANRTAYAITVAGMFRKLKYINDAFGTSLHNSVWILRNLRARFIVVLGSPRAALPKGFANN